MRIMREQFYKTYNKNTQFLTLWVKRIYVIAFNSYAFYWLYRQVFVRHSTDFEEYLLYFFTVAGMHFFVLDNQDVFIKKKK